MEPGPSSTRRSPSEISRPDRSRDSSTSTLAVPRVDNDRDYFEEVAGDDQPGSLLQSLPSRVSGSTLFDIPPIQLVFDRNSVINATLLTREGSVYRVETDQNVRKTSLLDLQENKVVAVWKRRDLFPDIVQFEHRRKKLKLSKWLSKFSNEEIGNAFELTIEDRRFVWRSHPQYRLALFADDDFRTALAHCQMLQIPNTISLNIQDCFSGATKVEIIMSFLAVEHKLRMEEKRLRLHSGGAFVPV